MTVGPKNIYSSELVFSIMLELLSEGGEKDYPKRLAKKLKISAQMINDYLRCMEKKKIVRKIGNTKPQYYEINYKWLFLDILVCLKGNMVIVSESYNQKYLPKILKKENIKKVFEKAKKSEMLRNLIYCYLKIHADYRWDMNRPSCYGILTSYNMPKDFVLIAKEYPKETRQLRSFFKLIEHIEVVGDSIATDSGMMLFVESKRVKDIEDELSEKMKKEFGDKK